MKGTEADAAAARDAPGTGKGGDQALVPSHREQEVLRERFEILGLLGRGGQAVTYLGHDRRSDEQVAIKELSLGGVSDWKAVELFEREAKILESLDHLQIPTYVDAFHEESDGGIRFFLVQQFVDGTNLEAQLDAGAIWDEERARRLLGEMAEILAYLHSHSPPVIHRDIKPSNLIEGKDGRLYLIDFGAVQLVAPHTAGGSTVVGTTGYMPLEQFMGRAQPATDLYALGATVVHLLTRTHPADLKVARGRLQWSERANVSAELASVLDDLLEPMVEDRLDSATALREALGGASSAMVVAPAPGASALQVADPQWLERREHGDGTELVIYVQEGAHGRESCGRIMVSRRGVRTAFHDTPARLLVLLLVSIVFVVSLTVAVGAGNVGFGVVCAVLLFGSAYRLARWRRVFEMDEQGRLREGGYRQHKLARVQEFGVSADSRHIVARLEGGALVPVAPLYYSYGAEMPEAQQRFILETLQEQLDLLRS